MPDNAAAALDTAGESVSVMLFNYVNDAITSNSTAIVHGTLYTLLIFSVMTWTLIFFKAWQFSKAKRDNQTFDEAFWQSESLSDVQKMPLEKMRGSQAHVAQSGFVWLNEVQQAKNKLLKHQGVQADFLEQTLRQQLQHEQQLIEMGLTLLASIGTTSPFVGLFGTVIGIMHALTDITKKQSANLDVVAGPIGEALIATAIGIAVAVPAVLAYNFFLRSAKKHRAALERFADSFLHLACEK